MLLTPLQAVAPQHAGTHVQERILTWLMMSGCPTVLLGMCGSRGLPTVCPALELEYPQRNHCRSVAHGTGVHKRVGFIHFTVHS